MSAVRPGEDMLDTNGARIQAHGGSILYLDGIFYWYGENKGAHRARKRDLALGCALLCVH